VQDYDQDATDTLNTNKLETDCMYEGHPINKLLNGIIQLIFRI